jgi:hypothetical protein
LHVSVPFLSQPDANEAKVVPDGGFGGHVRTIVKVAGVAGALLLGACGGKDQLVDDSFKKDLELASAASPITLQNTQAGAQVVSAIERTTPPAPKRIAASQRVARHTPAPRATPRPVEVEAADVSPEVVEAPVQVAEAPVDIAPLPSRRPQPVTASGGGRDIGDAGDIGDRRGDGIGTIIGVVLRGGHGGIDECDPRTDGRRGGRGTIAINNRIPIIGTFPGSGRLGSAIPSGRVRF